MVCIVDGDSNGPALVGVVDDRSGRDWPARDWATPILQATHEYAAPLEVGASVSFSVRRHSPN